VSTFTLAPSTVQKFWDANGNPLAFGTLTTYAGGTNTPLATYTDSTGNTQNQNPLTLNSRGEASVWLPINVAYKFVVTDSLGNQIQVTDQIVNTSLISLYGGVDTGVANAYILTFSSPVPANTSGQVIFWYPSNSNTGPSTVNVNGGGVEPILNPNGTALGANQILAGQFAAIIQINGIWQLYGGSGTGVNVGTFGLEFPIAGAATVDLGSAPAHNVLISGTGASITSFGTSAQVSAPLYLVRVSGVNTLTQSSSLILPQGIDITTANGDAFLAEYMGSGNWRLVIYQQAAFQSIQVKTADTAITSNAILTADPVLVSNPLQVGQYALEAYLIFDSVASGAGFQWELAGTAVDTRGAMPVLTLGVVDASSVVSTVSPYKAALTYAAVSTSADSNQILCCGTLLVSTAGTLQIDWAQAASTASATTLRAGSYLKLSLIGNGANSNATQHVYSGAGSGTETIPSGVNTLLIEVWGGTGGGGTRYYSGGDSSGGGGGGSGAYSATSISVSGDGGKTMAYTVGAAGVAGNSGGSASSVSSGTFTVMTLTANGGGLGGAAPSLFIGGTGGTVGTASGGTQSNVSGNAGSAGTNYAGGGTGGDGGAGVPGINGGGNPGGLGAGINSGTNGYPGLVIFTYS
jgi:hypothetical protein